MGLDTVELVISIEQAFGVRISDEIAASLETPAHVIDYIQKLQPSGAGHACLTQRAFYQLRTAFIGEGLCTRGQFQTDADLRTLVTKAQRRRIWDKLKREANLKLPNLERPQALTLTLVAITILVSILLATLVGDSFKAMLGLTLVLLIAVGKLVAWLSKPFALCIPDNASTPARVVDYLLATSPKRFVDNNEPLTRSQIAATVKTLTCDFCDERDYREDAHFVKDLGLD